MVVSRHSDKELVFVAVALLFMVVFRIPLSWRRGSGGAKVERAGYRVDIERRSVGISDKRAS